MEECYWCGKGFIKKRYNQIYCTKKCQIHQSKIIYEAKKSKLINCEWCGMPFRVSGRHNFGRKYCSSKCSYERRYVENIKSKQPHHILTKNCVLCGKVFKPDKRVRTIKIYCSQTCAAKAWELNNPEKAYEYRMRKESSPLYKLKRRERKILITTLTTSVVPLELKKMIALTQIPKRNIRDKSVFKSIRKGETYEIYI